MAAKLTEAEIRKAKADPAKVVTLKAELGLSLEIFPSGKKTWRLRTRTPKDTTTTLGYHPDMSLAQARQARDAARQAVPVVLAPVEVEPVQITFREVAGEWHLTNKDSWKPSHTETVWTSLEREVFPALGDLPIADIRAPQIKDVLKAIEARGALDFAHDVRQRVEAVFRYAEACGMRQGNPAAAMKEVLKALPAAINHPAVGDIIQAREAFTACEAAPAAPVTRLAFRFMALTAQRSGEVRQAEWSEFEGLDSDSPVWRIPAEHMKMGKEHVVPLSRQAVEVLDELVNLTGRFPLAFASVTSPRNPMAERALRELHERAGLAGRQVPHGWRSTFSTIMNGRRKHDRGVIDLMLAHAPKDKVEGAYNRQEHLEVRREIAQEWADILLNGMPGAAALVGLPRR